MGFDGKQKTSLFGGVLQTPNRARIDAMHRYALKWLMAKTWSAKITRFIFVHKSDVSNAFERNPKNCHEKWKSFVTSTISLSKTYEMFKFQLNWCENQIKFLLILLPNKSKFCYKVCLELQFNPFNNSHINNPCILL